MMLPYSMKFEIFLISCQPNGLWMLFNWIWITSLGFCRDRENNNKRMLTLKNWLQQEKGFKRITKKLKMVHLFSFLLLLLFYWIYQFGLMMKLFVFVCFTLVKPNGKERFRWWISMRSQNPRMPSLERTKVIVVAVITGGTSD